MGWNPSGCRWGSSLPSDGCVFCAVNCARSARAVSESLQQNGDVRKQRWVFIKITLSRNFFSGFFCFCFLRSFLSFLNNRRSPTGALLVIWSEGMEVAPAFSLLLCVSLAADWEFVDTNFTHIDDAIDYKDPCKAGTVRFYLLCEFIDLLHFRFVYI